MGKARGGEHTYGGGRKRESTYLDRELSRRFREFYRQRPWLHTRSKTTEAAIEFYLHYAELYGLDERHWPNIQPVLAWYEQMKRKYGVDAFGIPKLPHGGK